MKEGGSFNTFGATLKFPVSKSACHDWTQAHPEFLEAKKVGETLAQLWWEQQGRDGLLGKVPGFNATVWIFSMKNKFGWQDRQEISHLNQSTSSDSLNMTPEQRKERIRFLTHQLSAIDDNEQQKRSG